MTRPVMDFRCLISGVLLLLVCPIVVTEVIGFDYTIGVYYFPGWHSRLGYWKDLQGAQDSRSPGVPWPDREPILGYYPEEEEWVAARHSAWAAAYGIDFIAYDWYWDGTRPYHEHAIQAFLKVAGPRKPKFCLVWANHSENPLNQDEYERMVDYWIRKYLKDGSYFGVDGKPVVIIFSPQHLRDAVERFGRTTAEMFEIARTRARRQGIPGIYFVGVTPASSYWVLKYLPENGYDALTGYNYHSSSFSGEFTGHEPVATSYAALLGGYESQWDWILGHTRLPYILPMTAGWDSRPWRSATAHDNCGSTPESFRNMLERGRATMDGNPSKTRKVGIIYAWNEFAEGGYIEPTKRWGFQYLEAVRNTFRK